MLEIVRSRTRKNKYNYLYDIGTRWFKLDQMIRIIDRNKRKVTVQDERTKEVYTLSIKTLNRNYTRLIPTGLLQIGILQANSKLRMDTLFMEYCANEESAYVNYGADNGTMVIHPLGMIEDYRRCPSEYQKAFRRGGKERQSAADVLLESSVIQDYYNYDPYEINEFIESIPYYETNLKHYRFIMLYMDDSLDTIIPLLGKYEIKKYNACLQKVADLLKHESEDVVDISEFMNMKTFLNNINLMYLIDCSVDITNLEFRTKTIAEDEQEDSSYNKAYMIDDKALYELLRYSIGYNISDIIMMRYWYDIDLSSISNNYALIRNTKDDKLYIFIYRSNGVRKDALSDAFSISEQNKLASRFRL
jgi:hypothetical protein